MRIPDVAARLREKAVEHDDPELVELANELRRRRPVKVASPTARALTPELVETIQVFTRHHPRMTQREVGIRFGVNQGRVSEATRGKRT